MCEALETTTKASDVIDQCTDSSKKMTWNGAMFVECALCTDGAPAMLGSKSGFQTLIKQKAPDAKGLHCMIHRYALACKTLPESFKEVLNGVIKVDNHIKSSAINSRLFK